MLAFVGRGDHAGIHRATGGTGLGTFPGDLTAMGFPSGALLGMFPFIDGSGAFVHEVKAQGCHDDHRVDSPIETPVSPRLETVQEEHDFTHLEIRELGDDDSGELRHLALVQFLPDAAVFTQVIELGQHPHRGGLVMVGAAQGEQRGCRAEERLVHVFGAILLHGGVHHLHERLQVRMGLQQGVDHSLQAWREHDRLLDAEILVQIGDVKQGR